MLLFMPEARLWEQSSLLYQCQPLLVIFYCYLSGGAQQITLLFQCHPLLCNFAFTLKLTIESGPKPLIPANNKYNKYRFDSRLVV